MVVSIVDNFTHLFSDTDISIERSTGLILTRAVALSTRGEAANVTDNVKNEHYRRIKLLLDACADPDTPINKVLPNRLANRYTSAKYNFSYYKIPKTGCTFWTQIFAVLNSASNSDETEEIFYKQRGHVHSAMHRAVTNTRHSSGPYVIPVRDPYSRLYSGYMDKIFLSLFLQVEDMIISSQRKHTPKASECVRNATFLEFLKMIVEKVHNGVKVNGHWAPITSLCNPCTTDILAIAKQETFSTDVEFILNKVGVKNDKLEVIRSALYEHKLESFLPSYIKEVLNHRTCKPKEKVAEDMWYTFKVNGYLKENLDFPLAHVRDTNFTLTPETLTQLVFKAISDKPLTSEQSRRQRRRALIKAYKDVDGKTIKGIQEVFKRDFTLFGYSTEPPRY